MKLNDLRTEEFYSDENGQMYARVARHATNNGKDDVMWYRWEYDAYEPAYYTDASDIAEELENARRDII